MHLPLVLLIQSLILCGSAPAQDQNWDNWDLAADPSFYRNPDRQVLRSFRVPESAEAQRLIDRAQDKIRDEHFAAAVDELHAVITSYSGKVYQAGRESLRGSKGCARFIGAAEMAHYLLSRLPPVGREVYESFARKKASIELERARNDRDIRALESLARTFATASIGIDAHRFLADYYLEKGEVELAIIFLKKCLLYAGEPAPDVVARLARALDQAGHDEAARDYLGASGETEETLAHDLARNPPLVGPPGFDWPTMGGRPDRNRPMPLLDGVDFFSDRWIKSTFNDLLRNENPFLVDSQNVAPFRLVRTGDVVYVNDSVSVRAFSVYSGEEIWHFEGPLEARHGSRIYFNLGDYVGRSRRRGTVTSELIAGGTAASNVLLVNLHETRPTRAKKILRSDVINKPIPVRHLFALDARSGRLLWRQGGHDPDPEAFMNRLSIPSPPVVVGDRVFCSGHLIEGGIRNFLFCFDLATGETIWQTSVGVGQQQLTMFDMNFREYPSTPLTELDGTLYFSSNLGYVGAVDAITGQIRWFTEYEGIPIPEISHYTNPTPRTMHWYNEPPRVAGNTMVATPLDAETAVAFDRHTGRASWSLPSIHLCRTHCRYLLGIREKTVIFGSAAGATAVDIDSGSLVWRTAPLIDGEPCTGRGAITEDRIFLNLGSGLIVVDAASGRIVAEHDGGEILSTDQSIVLLGDVTARVTSDVVRVSFDAEGMLKMALGRLADPSRSKDGRGLFNDLVFIGDMYRLEGDLDQAHAFYSRASERAGGGGPGATVRIRTRLYRINMENGFVNIERGRYGRAMAAFGLAVASARSAAEDLAASVELIDLFLGSKDWDVLSRVVDRLDGEHRNRVVDFEERFGLDESPVGFYTTLVRCRAAEMRRDPAERLAYLRGILVNWPDEEYLPAANTDRAWDWAAAEIGAIIVAEGREVYAACESEAEDAMERALADGSTDLLASVAQRFPNARVASRAVLERARLLLARQEAAEAYRALSDLASRSSGSATLPHIHYLMALASEKEGNQELASALFEKIRRFHSHVPSLWEEGVTYGELIPAAPSEGARGAVLPRLPRAPLSESEIEFASAKVDLLEVHGADLSSLEGRVLLRLSDPERLALVDFLRSETIWERELNLNHPNDSRWVLLAGQTLTVCYDRSIIGLDLDSGRRIWERSFDSWVFDVDSGLGLLKIVHSIVDDDYEQENVMTAECVNPATGATLWRKDITECTEMRLIPSVEVFAAIVSGTSLLVLDALTGSTLHRLDLDYFSVRPATVEPPPGRLFLHAREKETRRWLLLGVDSLRGEMAWRFSLGHRAPPADSIMRSGSDLLVLTEGDRNMGDQKSLHLIDTAQGRVRQTFKLAPQDALFSGADNDLAGTSCLFVHPVPVGRDLPVSGLDVAMGSWRFEDSILDVRASGGRYPTVHPGVYAADGLVVAVDYSPSRRDRPLVGRVFFVDGRTGKVIFSRDTHLPDGFGSKGLLRPLGIQVALRNEGFLMVSANRLICIRGTRK